MEKEVLKHRASEKTLDSLDEELEQELDNEQLLLQNLIDVNSNPDRLR
jgi:hypothetical protein